MSELVVIVYPRPEDAERVIEHAQRLAAQHLLDIEDYVSVARDEAGTLRLDPRDNRPLHGAARGVLWGALLGRVFGSTWIGAGLGLAAGAMAGRAARGGIDETFVRELAASMPPGSSAVFALVRRAVAAKVRPELARYGGTFLHTSLTPEEEELLQAAWDEEHRKAVIAQTLRPTRTPGRARRLVSRRRH